MYHSDRVLSSELASALQMQTAEFGDTVVISAENNRAFEGQCLTLARLHAHRTSSAPPAQHAVGHRAPSLNTQAITPLALAHAD